jgi:uncharacterized protein (TIRG00374 family)
MSPLESCVYLSPCLCVSVVSQKMSHEKDARRKRFRNVVISVLAGGSIVWFLLSKIDPRDIPHAVSNIPLWSLLIAFLLYATSVYLKAVRFKIILRTGISLRQLFPIVSLYMFFANVLPMRMGELSYVYLLKKQTRTPGAKGFASLIVGGIADAAVILIAMFIVGCYLRDALAEGMSHFLSALGRESRLIGSWAYGLMIAIVLLVGGVIVFSISRLRKSGRSEIEKRESKIIYYVSITKAKVLEVGRELADISFDIRLLGIAACSILIITLRFATQWYLVRSMGIAIGIWELSFALLFGVLFSLIPIHGPAGFGTVEAPWVASLLILNVPREDAIISGFGLHIIIIMYCIILGIFGFSISGSRFSVPEIANQK